MILTTDFLSNQQNAYLFDWIFKLKAKHFALPYRKI